MSNQKEEQRRSFAYGNARLSNDRVTREMVAKEASSYPQGDESFAAVLEEWAAFAEEIERLRVRVAELEAQHEEITRLVGAGTLQTLKSAQCARRAAADVLRDDIAATRLDLPDEE